MAERREFVSTAEQWLTSERLGAILDAIPAAVTLWDCDLNCWFANAVAVADWDLAGDRPHGSYLDRIAGEDASADVAVRFRRALAGESVVLDRVLSDDDSVRRHLSGTLSPFLGADGIAGASLVDVDVSPVADISSAARIARDRASRLAERQRVGAELDNRVLDRLDAVLASVTAGIALCALPEPTAVLEVLDDCIEDLRWAVRGKSGGEADRGVVPLPPEPTTAPRMSSLRPGRAGWSASDSIALLDQIPAIVSSWDQQQHNTFSNRPALAWYGRAERAAVVGAHMQDLLRPEYYEPEIEMLHAALAGERQQHDRLVPDPQGSLRNLQVTHAPVIEDGRVVGSYVLVLDVTARVAAENEALAVREKLAALHERQRISDDLHNVVIQRLFAAALAAKAATRAVGSAAASCLLEARDNLVQSLADLRQSVSVRGREPVIDDVANAVTRLVREWTHGGSLVTTAQLIGPVNDIRPQVAAELLSTLSTALESSATDPAVQRLNVTIAVDESTVRLRVTDGEISRASDAGASSRTLTVWSSPR